MSSAIEMNNLISNLLTSRSIFTHLFRFRALFVDFNFKPLSGVISSRLLLMVLGCTESVVLTFVSRSVDIFAESFIFFVLNLKHFFYAKNAFSCYTTR